MEKAPKNYRLKFIKYIKKEHVEYQIKLICFEDSNINVEFAERYSNLKDLHDAFKKCANSINFPKFPPKKFFGNTDEKFLNQRQTALEHYFNTILGSKEFSNIPAIKKWVEGLIKKYDKSTSQDKEAPVGDKNGDKTGDNLDNKLRAYSNPPNGNRVSNANNNGKKINKFKYRF